MRRPALLLFLLLFPSIVSAHEPVTSIREEFLAGVDEAEDKLIALAEATPVEKMTWRPAPGVRSFSEVYTHVAGGNYFLASFVGRKAPADLPKDIEKITDRTKIVAEMRRSFEHIRVAAREERDFNAAVKLFGTNTSRRGVYITMLNHLHEHLGQAIAYARMNGVVPPWSR